MYGNCNAPPAVTYSAIIYCLRCLVASDIPLNQGCLTPITIRIPPGCLLRPSEQAAVVGGNVLTSQRVTDVVLKGDARHRAALGTNGGEGRRERRATGANGHRERGAPGTKGCRSKGQRERTGTWSEGR